MTTDVKKIVSEMVNMRYNIMCTNYENLHLTDTKTKLCHLQCHVRDIVLTWLYAKASLPVFWKLRQAGYIIKCILEKPVGTVKVKREEGGLVRRKNFEAKPSRTSENVLLEHGKTLLLLFIIAL